MSRNAEAFMEQLAYWWTNLADKEEKIKYVNQLIETWDRLGQKETNEHHDE